MVRIEPPCNTDVMSLRQGTQDSELQIISDVAEVAVLHGQMIARSTVQISEPAMTGAIRGLASDDRSTARRVPHATPISLAASIAE